MAQLPDGERLRVLEVRAYSESTGRRKSWEVVAEETHHAKATVIQVDGWLQSLPWSIVAGLPPEIQRLRNDYTEHLEADVLASVSITGVTFGVRSSEPLSMMDQAFGEGDAGSSKAYVDVDIAATRPVRLDGIAMVVSGELVHGHLIPDDDRMKGSGTYLAVFNLPKVLCDGGPDAHVVVYADGQEFRSGKQAVLHAEDRARAWGRA